MVAIIIVVLIVLVIGAVEFGKHTELLKKLGEPEKDEFTEYVKHELHKANEGAANAEAWAVALIERWRRHRG